MWRQGFRAGRRRFRGLSTAARRRQEDAGDWAFSPEWWEPVSGSVTVFREQSGHGNGVVSVVAHHSSRPRFCSVDLRDSCSDSPLNLKSSDLWPELERELREKYVKLHPESDSNPEFRILGYQWRVLHFNDNTRQSTTKVMSAYRKSSPGSLYLMQEPDCLAVPYLKSMLSAGLSTVTSLGFDLPGVIRGSQTMRILCVGLGGGSLPLFLASNLRGAIVDVVEIDPVVVAAAIQAMGFPSCKINALVDLPNQDLWPETVQERISIHTSDAVDFIVSGAGDPYDLVIVDAYDGDDIFPHKLWDINGEFLRSLPDLIHSHHGAIVVNLHADSDVELSGGGGILPMGRYVSQICKAYKKRMGTAFKISVPWLCNVSLVACRRSPATAFSPICSSIIAAGDLVEDLLDLPFPCVEYLKRGFAVIP